MQESFFFLQAPLPKHLIRVAIKFFAMNTKLTMLSIFALITFSSNQKIIARGTDDHGFSAISFVQNHERT